VKVLIDMNLSPPGAKAGGRSLPKSWRGRESNSVVTRGEKADNARSGQATRVVANASGFLSPDSGFEVVGRNGSDRADSCAFPACPVEGQDGAPAWVVGVGGTNAGVRHPPFQKWAAFVGVARFGRLSGEPN